MQPVPTGYRRLSLRNRPLFALGALVVTIVGCSSGSQSSQTDKPTAPPVVEQFGATDYEVTIDVGAGGKAAFGGAVVEANSHLEIPIQTHDRHIIDTVSGCDGSLTEDEGKWLYTTGTITESCTVKVRFQTADPQLAARSAPEEIRLSWDIEGEVDVIWSTDRNCDWSNYTLCDDSDIIVGATGGSLTLKPEQGLALDQTYFFVVRQGAATSEVRKATPARIYPTAYIRQLIYAGERLFAETERSGFQADLAIADGRTGEIASLIRGLDGVVNTAIADAQGGWIIGGEFTTIEGVEAPSIARIRHDGSLDQQWRPDIQGKVKHIGWNGKNLVVYSERGLGGDTAELYLVNAESGHTVSSIMLEGPHDIVKSRGDTVFLVKNIPGGVLTRFTATLTAIDATSGKEIWSHILDGSVSSISIANNGIYAFGSIREADDFEVTGIVGFTMGGKLRMIESRTKLQPVAANDTALYMNWDPISAIDTTEGNPITLSESNYNAVMELGNKVFFARSPKYQVEHILDLHTNERLLLPAAVSHGSPNNLPASSTLALGGDRVLLGTHLKIDSTPTENGYMMLNAATGMASFGGETPGETETQSARKAVLNESVVHDVTTGTSFSLVTEPGDVAHYNESIAFIVGDRIVVVGRSNTMSGSSIAVYDKHASESPIWTLDVNALSDAEVDNSRIYVAGNFEKIGNVKRIGLAALDLESGSLLDIFGGGDVERRAVYDLLLKDDKLFATMGSSSGRQLVSFSTTDGKKEILLADKDFWQLSSHDNKLYVGVSQQVLAYDLNSRQHEWLPDDVQIEGYLETGGGRLYSTTNGRLTAWDLNTYELLW